LARSRDSFVVPTSVGNCEKLGLESWLGKLHGFKSTGVADGGDQAFGARAHWKETPTSGIWSHLSVARLISRIVMTMFNCQGMGGFSRANQQKKLPMRLQFGNSCI
jgi:hypothetical protein